MKKNKKTLRQDALRELISSYPIEDQSSLIALLKEKYGIITNQSIVSRDLRELGVSKKIVDHTSMYKLSTSDVTQELLLRAVVNVMHNENLIVVKTVAGLASFVGDFLDEKEFPELLATIAGENVVLVIPKSIHTIKEIYQTLCNLLLYTLKEQKDHNAQ